MTPCPPPVKPRAGPPPRPLQASSHLRACSLASGLSSTAPLPAVGLQRQRADPGAGDGEPVAGPVAGLSLGPGSSSAVLGAGAGPSQGQLRLPAGARMGLLVPGSGV